MELDFRKDPSLLSMVVDAMADGVYTLDNNGIFVAWSAGAERITGYSSKDMVGKPCHILEGPNCKGFSKTIELLKDPSSSGSGIYNQECKILSKDGRELYIYGNVRVVTDAQGKVLGAVGSFTDLTSFILANEKIAILEEQVKMRTAFQGLIGKSELMQEVCRRLRLASQSDVTVLLRGESGTGKELAAVAIHNLSDRSCKPFLALNCSAIPETLLESELFGHVKGAFTGAARDKVGVFHAADGGTLFLDEIGDMSPLLQLKLLRVLQEREVWRLGDNRPFKVNVRLVTATNRNLESLLTSGAVREDFYYRIRVFEIVLPPLRDRREDISLLVDHFIEEFSQSKGKLIRGIARDALQRMLEYPWPGNVRELRNAIEHAFVTVGGDRITLLDLPVELRMPRTSSTLSTPFTIPKAESEPSPTAEDLLERRGIEEALRRSGGNRTEAAKSLGISRVTLWKKIKQFHIKDIEKA
jgi:PAS domain S-box-containing protein